MHKQIKGSLAVTQWVATLAFMGPEYKSRASTPNLNKFAIHHVNKLQYNLFCSSTSARFELIFLGLLGVLPHNVVKWGGWPCSPLALLCIPKLQSHLSPSCPGLAHLWGAGCTQTREVCPGGSPEEAIWQGALGFWVGTLSMSSDRSSSLFT